MSQVGAILTLGVGLFSLWVLVFVCWQQYRLDSYRQKLFSLRHELFQYAIEANIPFDTLGYGSLRTRINAMIRFAHRVTTFRLLLSMLLCRVVHLDLVAMEREFSQALCSLPDEQSEHLRDIHTRMAKATATHIISGQPALWVLMPLLILVQLPIALLRGVRPSPRLTAAKELRVDIMEAQAMKAQQEDEQMQEALAAV